MLEVVKKQNIFFSRIVGAVMRSFLILIGLLIEFLLILGGLIIFLAWFLPFLSILGLILASKFYFKQPE